MTKDTDSSKKDEILELINKINKNICLLTAQYKSGQYSLLIECNDLLWEIKKRIVDKQ